jgi:hypothetical protein
MAQKIYDKVCYLCGRRLAPLDRPERVTTGQYSEKWKHADRCPVPARVTSPR